MWIVLSLSVLSQMLANMLYLVVSWHEPHVLLQPNDTDILV